MKALLALLLMVPAVACDDTPVAAAPAFDDTLVTVSGTVKFDGIPPPVKVVKALNADPACAAMHAQPLPMENLVVDADGGVRWAFVWVKSGLEGKTFAPPQEGIFVDQKGCMYSPHVVAVQVGQPVLFRNNDPLLHNVHGLPFMNKPWNFGQIQGVITPFKPTAVEVPVAVRCDVHPWMSCFICVVDTPYFCVTDPKGKFEIPKLPAGKYVLGVWHEGLKTKDGKNEIPIEVKADKTLEILMEKPQQK